MVWPYRGWVCVLISHFEFFGDTDENCKQIADEPTFLNVRFFEASVPQGHLF